MLSSPPELQLPMMMTARTSRAQAASRGRARRQVMGLRTIDVRSRPAAKARRPANGSPRLEGPVSEAAEAPVAADAAVVKVRVVVTAATPGVALGGENPAVHLLGRPAHANVTAESNDPNCGVNVTV